MIVVFGVMEKWSRNMGITFSVLRKTPLITL